MFNYQQFNLELSNNNVELLRNKTQISTNELLEIKMEL